MRKNISTAQVTPNTRMTRARMGHASTIARSDFLNRTSNCSDSDEDYDYYREVDEIEALSQLNFEDYRNPDDINFISKKTRDSLQESKRKKEVLEDFTDRATKYKKDYKVSISKHTFFENHIMAISAQYL